MPGAEGGRFIQFLPAIILALISFCSIGWMMFAVRDPMARMVVVFSPGSSRSDNLMAVIAANGLIIDERAGGLVFEVQPVDLNFLPAIRAGRAWAVLAGGLSGGCAGDTGLRQEPLDGARNAMQRGGVNG